MSVSSQQGQGFSPRPDMDAPIVSATLVPSPLEAPLQKAMVREGVRRAEAEKSGECRSQANGLSEN